MTADFLRCVAAAGQESSGPGVAVSAEADAEGNVAAPAAGPYSSLARARRDLDIVFRAYEQLP